MQNILDKIFPKYCLNCKKEGEFLCKNCKKKLKVHPEECPICHKYSQNFKVCTECKKQYHIYFENLIIGFKYNDIIKKLILNFKYNHQKEIGKFLSNQIKYFLYTNNLIKNTKNNLYITYIPNHWTKKYFIKGYNQSFILSKNIGNEINIPNIQLCTKQKNTKKQTSLSKSERIKNIKNSFYPKDKNLHKLFGKETIIIVDDITTTTSTINETAKVIKKYLPNCYIIGLVIAKN